MKSRHIAILHHSKASPERINEYTITHMSLFWEADGHKVTHIFGPNNRIPADIIITHVDLSVVPDVYLDFARSYPVSINVKVKDIRKTTFSNHLLKPDSTWDGKVIVKSDLNYAGKPEHKYKPWFSRIFNRRSIIRHPNDYLTFEHLSDVPYEIFTTPDLIVQKFLPEYENGLYHLRMFQFLGNKYTCTRIGSPDPIVRIGHKSSLSKISPHPEVITLRNVLGFDYGKFDYVVHNDEVLVIDINKTPGGGCISEPGINQRRRDRAIGLYDYFPD